MSESNDNNPKLANERRKLKLLQARALVKKYCGNTSGAVVDEFIRERRSEAQRDAGN